MMAQNAGERMKTKEEIDAQINIIHKLATDQDITDHEFMVLLAAVIKAKEKDQTMFCKACTKPNLN